MRQLTSNFLSIIGSDMARRLLGFLTIAYLARTITATDFGAINIGFTVLSYALMAGAGGLITFGTREVARGLSLDFVNTLVSVRIVAAFLMYVIVSIIALAFISSTIVASLMLVFCLSLFGQAVLLEWYFLGKEEMGVVGISRFLSAFIYFLLIILVVRSSSDLLFVAVAAVIGDIIAAIALLVFYGKRNKGIHFHFSLKGWKSLIGQAFPLGAGSLLAHVSINLPPIVIGIIMTNADVGFYSAASKMVFFLLMVDRVISTLLLPASSRLHAFAPKALSSTLSTALRWIFVIALPVCLGGTMLADRIIVLVFGVQYQSSAIVLQILIWFVLFTMIHTIYTSGAIAIKKEKEYSRVMLMSAVIYAVSIAASTILFGIIGASVAIVISEAMTLFLMYRTFHVELTVAFPRSLPLIIVSACLMGLMLFLLPQEHLVVSVLLGGGIYVATLLIMRAVTVADVMSLVRRV